MNANKTVLEEIIETMIEITNKAQRNLEEYELFTKAFQETKYQDLPSRKREE